MPTTQDLIEKLLSIAGDFGCDTKGFRPHLEQALTNYTPKPTSASQVTAGASTDASHLATGVKDTEPAEHESSTGDSSAVYSPAEVVGGEHLNNEILVVLRLLKDELDRDAWPIEDVLKRTTQHILQLIKAHTPHVCCAGDRRCSQPQQTKEEVI